MIIAPSLPSFWGGGGEAERSAAGGEGCVSQRPTGSLNGHLGAQLPMQGVWGAENRAPQRHIKSNIINVAVAQLIMLQRATDREPRQQRRHGVRAVQQVVGSRSNGPRRDEWSAPLCSAGA